MTIVDISDAWFTLFRSELVTHVIVVAAWFSCAFFLGVGFAAYRAIGWVERMKAWAYSVPLDEPITDVCIATAMPDGKGLE